MRVDVRFTESKQTFNANITEDNKTLDTDFGNLFKLYGKSAYEIAVDNGFVGTEQEWLESLHGERGERGERGETGKTGAAGKDGSSIKSITKTATNGNVDTYTVTLTDGSKTTFTVTNGKDGKDGKDGYTPQKNVDYFDGKNGKDGQDGYTPVKGVDYFDGKDGFSPVVAVADIEGGHRVTITDKDGNKTFDVMDGKDGQGGTGGTSVQADWNVNDENDPAYVKNRTHWVERSFEPISVQGWNITVNGTVPDTIDMSTLGLGVFFKISDQCLSWDQLDGSQIRAHVNGLTNESYITGLPPEETMGFTFGQFHVTDLEGNDLCYGAVCVAPSAMEIPEYGLSIPSAGTYITHNWLETQVIWIIEIKKEKLHLLDEKYVPHKTPYMIDTGLTIVPDGEFKMCSISTEALDMLLNLKQTTIAFRLYGRLYVTFVVSSVEFGNIRGTQIVQTGELASYKDTKYLVDWFVEASTLYISVKPFTPEDYQTKSQVQSMIDDAITNLPKYQGEVEEV
jgi:hypothetical protein